MAVRLLRSGDWPAACHIGRSAALSANHRCAVGLLPLPRVEFRQLKLILHSELRRRAASRRALPCPSSCKCLGDSDTERISKIGQYLTKLYVECWKFPRGCPYRVELIAD